VTGPGAAPFPPAMLGRAAAEVAPGEVAAVGPGTPPGLREALERRGVTVVDGPSGGSDGDAGRETVDVLFVGPVQAAPDGLRLPIPSPASRRNGVARSPAGAPGPSGGRGPARVVAVFPQAGDDGAGPLRMVRRLDEGPRGAPVRADVWVTDLGVYAVGTDGAVLRELAPGCTARQAQEASDLPLQADAALDEVQRLARE